MFPLLLIIIGDHGPFVWFVAEAGGADVVGREAAAWEGTELCSFLYIEVISNVAFIAIITIINPISFSLCLELDFNANISSIKKSKAES